MPGCIDGGRAASLEGHEPSTFIERFLLIDACRLILQGVGIAAREIRRWCQQDAWPSVWPTCCRCHCAQHTHPQASDQQRSAAISLTPHQRSASHTSSDQPQHTMSPCAATRASCMGVSSFSDLHIKALHIAGWTDLSKESLLIPKDRQYMEMGIRQGVKGKLCNTRSASLAAACLAGWVVAAPAAVRAAYTHRARGLPIELCLPANVQDVPFPVCAVSLPLRCAGVCASLYNCSCSLMPRSLARSHFLSSSV